MIATAAPSHLLSVSDLDAEQFAALLDLAGQMKRHPLAWRSVLDGSSPAPRLVFRMASEAGAIGGHGAAVTGA